MIKPDELIKLCMLSPVAYNVIREYGLQHIRWLYTDDDLNAVNALDGLMQRYPGMDPIVAMAKEPRVRDTLQSYEEGGMTTFLVALASDLEHSDKRTEAKRELLDYVTQMATVGRRALEDKHAQILIHTLESDSSTDINQLVATREMDLRRAGHVGRLESLGTVLDEEKAKPVERRFTTGLFLLDDALDGGFQLGTVCTIMATPGAGKTTLMGQLLICMTNNNDDCSALWFSMEQTRRQTINGVCSFVEGQGMDAHHANELIRGLPIKFNDDVSNVDEIIDLIRIEKRRDPNLKLVVIDYAQLLDLPDAKGDLFQLMFYASKAFKEVSRREEVVIMVAAQIDKASVLGQGKVNPVPSIFSVKGGGDLAQASSYMLALHEPDAKENKVKRKLGENVRIDIWVQKNRFGRAGFPVETWYAGKTRSFHVCLEDSEFCDERLLTELRSK